MTTNDSEGTKLESCRAYMPPATSCNDSSRAASNLAFERKLARLSRAGYVIGVVAVVICLSSGITSESKLAAIAGMSVLVIVAGITYFFLNPIPDPGGEKASTEIRPARRVGRGCQFSVMWVIIQGVCWWGITTFSWPTRFVPNEIFGGGDKIVIPEAITIAFWTQLLIGLAIADRYRVFALIQLFVAAFIMSRPSFYQSTKFSVDFHVPNYLWGTFWIQFALLAAALRIFIRKRVKPLDDDDGDSMH